MYIASSANFGTLVSKSYAKPSDIYSKTINLPTKLLEKVNLFSLSSIPNQPLKLLLCGSIPYNLPQFHGPFKLHKSGLAYPNHSKSAYQLPFISLWFAFFHLSSVIEVPSKFSPKLSWVGTPALSCILV